MAWLSLVIVTLLFFTPVIGIASRVAAQDMIASINLYGISVAIPIPGIGSLRLFLVCFAVWLILWLALYLPDRWLASKALREHKPYRDFLSRVGFWNDLVNAFRPTVSNRIAVWLARLVFFGLLIKMILGFLLQLVVDGLLPLLAAWLSRLGDGFTVSLGHALGQGAQSLLRFGMNTAGMLLLILSVMVMIADLAFQDEQRYRADYAIQQHQSTQRKRQNEIVISATQQ